VVPAAAPLRAVISHEAAGKRGERKSARVVARDAVIPISYAPRRYSARDERRRFSGVAGMSLREIAG